MGSHIIDVLRQGIWASLTGGWFFDPQQSIFCNTFHLYLWIYFLSFPLILHLVNNIHYFSSFSSVHPNFVFQVWSGSLYPWIFYTLFTGLVFVVIKLLNAKLHKMFDTSDPIEESSCTDDKPSSIKDPEAETANSCVSPGDLRFILLYYHHKL